MATHGPLTVGKLKHFLSAFEDDTPVVMGDGCGLEDTTYPCHANTLYLKGKEDTWPWVVIDRGENL